MISPFRITKSDNFTKLFLITVGALESGSLINVFEILSNLGHIFKIRSECVTVFRVCSECVLVCLEYVPY